jgi:hypothetical protein
VKTRSQSSSAKNSVNQSMEEVKQLGARIIFVSAIIGKLNGASEKIG